MSSAISSPPTSAAHLDAQAPRGPAPQILQAPALLALLLASVVPPLLAFNISPSATLFNQLAALGGWALVLCLLARELPRVLGRAGQAAVLALGLLMLAPLASHLWTGLPLSLALSSSAMLAAAMLLLFGAQGLNDRARQLWFEVFCWGLLIAGLLSLGVSLVQVFAPQWADGNVIARSGVPGRAVGNMRQPNHLASLLMWSCVAAVYLGLPGRLKPFGRAWVLPAILFGLIFAVVLSGSRTGVIGVLILAAWGGLDRRLPRAPRFSLLATPLMLALCWWLVAAWSASSGHALGVESRLAEGAGSPSRIAILSNALALLKLHPWLGVGWGEFNLAWTLSEFPNRPVAFFDHCHNLPMQLAVELGLPLSLSVLGLLGWSLWRALRMSLQARDEGQAWMRRCAFMLVLMIGLHSLLEYPLWYAYFLLPTAFAFGLALGQPDEQVQRGQVVQVPGLPRLLSVAGAVLMLGTAFAVWDYQRVVVIYSPGENAAPLPERIHAGQQSLFFSTQADYAAATSLGYGPQALAAAQRSAHQLIDARLMMAWAKSLHAVGDDQKASYVAERLREFRNKSSEPFFAECTALEEAELAALKPYQCVPPQQQIEWREMR
ncbi:O-antigen ligase [Paucibacter oligotrophus]|uniref:O-antigen ligase n=1 Tax=Roseateles oligotrophus TaxID=1769250 RepID=A0A840L7R5_9BURK|nr:O-antigen ligase family protein [Roseateles oligotrophus]MBB4842705.1 O-antigen ligase [Roseateles oligotrophus]